MAKNIHKGTELNNVKETWEQNEQSQNAGAPATPGEDLQRTIEKEAKEYDDANKEERILGGERASIDDDNTGE